jgi:3-hydroxyisobutyrate dehydrogenase-like beta-hydroxyacid dehydrogenase
MNISFVGLGAIGAPMASHIARVHALTVGTDPSRAEAFAATNRRRVVETPGGGSRRGR